METHNLEDHTQPGRKLEITLEGGRVVALKDKTGIKMDKIPSENEIREFWEWCGCYVVSIPLFLDQDKLIYDLVFPDGKEKRCSNLGETLDLNNLSRYAIPKAIEKILTVTRSKLLAYDRLFALWLRNIAEEFKIEDALFWAIWEVIHSGKA